MEMALPQGLTINIDILFFRYITKLKLIENSCNKVGHILVALVPGREKLLRGHSIKSFLQYTLYDSILCHKNQLILGFYFSIISKFTEQIHLNGFFHLSPSNPDQSLLHSRYYSTLISLHLFTFLVPSPPLISGFSCAGLPRLLAIS